MNTEKCNSYIQDSIHPPDLIGLPADFFPLPSSPLSKPPDSPRHSVTNEHDDDRRKNEEEKKEDEKEQQQHILSPEEIPVDEYDNAINNNNETPYSVDESLIGSNRTGRKNEIFNYWKNKAKTNTSMDSPKNEMNPSSLSSEIITTTNSDAAPFDESVKEKQREKDKITTAHNINEDMTKDIDEESAPDDEKNVYDSSLQNVMISSTKDNGGNNDREKSIESIPTTTKKITKSTTITRQQSEKDDIDCNEEQLSLAIKSKSLLLHSNNDDDDTNEPPSLSVKRETSGMTATAEVSTFTKSSLSLVEEANARPSLMVPMTSDLLSFSKSDIIMAQVQAKTTTTTTPLPTKQKLSTPSTATTTTTTVTRHSYSTSAENNISNDKQNESSTNMNSSDFCAVSGQRTKGSESNRLAALKRDIMSLKSSLSDMNKQLYADQKKPSSVTQTNIRETENVIRNEIDTNTITSTDAATTATSDNNNDVPTAMDKSTTTKGVIPMIATVGSHISTQSSLKLPPLIPPNNRARRVDRDDDSSNHSNGGHSNLYDPPKGEDIKMDIRITNSLKEKNLIAISDEFEKENTAAALVVVVGDGVGDNDDLLTTTNTSLQSDPITTASKMKTKSNDHHGKQTNSSQDKKLESVAAEEVVKDYEEDVIIPNYHSLIIDKKKATTQWSGSGAKNTLMTHQQAKKYSSNESIGKGQVTTASYRQMTPKKDLQGSDISADWLKEELRRRTFIKREINNAIEAREQKVEKQIVKEFPSFASTNIQGSQSTTDEEVAAITANDRSSSINVQRADYSSNFNEHPSTDKNMDGALPRKLDYIDTNNEGDKSGFQDFEPEVDYKDIQHEMKKFASETREKLREQSFTDIVQDPFANTLPVAFSSPISMNRSPDTEKPNTEPNFQTNTFSGPRIESHSKGTDNKKIKINFSDLQANDVPVLLSSMDSFDGIAPGDIALSLLSENTGRAETSVPSWANRVHGAIWRSRRMRRNMTQVVEIRPSDIDDSRVGNGLQTIASIQQAVLTHLKHDEIDQSINLTEGIVFASYSFFERSLDFREKNPTSDTGVGMIDFKPYIGVGLHNLGVLNLLKGDYEEALSYFSRAVENRKSYLGNGHPDYISSLVRLAICRYALNEFAEAHARLEEALMCAKSSCVTLEDRLQIAEVLNNLGCLAYMSGQPVAASSYYRDSMDIQFGALSDSLYIGNAMSGQSISLNISISRGNIGFLKLVTKDLPVAITALENALMEQQILLRGAHDTIIATMDHLALSNLLNGDQEKAALMFNRILQLQQNEYGPHDRRCFVTVDKINMVQSKGVQYKDAIEELRKTFSIPSTPASISNSSIGTKFKQSPHRDKNSQHQKSSGKNKNKKNKVMQVFSSMRKKNPH